MIASRTKAFCAVAAPLLAVLFGMPPVMAQSDLSAGSGPIKLFRYDAPAEVPQDTSSATAPATNGTTVAPSVPQSSAPQPGVPQSDAPASGNVTYVAPDLPRDIDDGRPDVAPVILPAPTADDRSRAEGIEIRKLDSRTIGATGPLTPAQGGLGLDLWAGMTADEVARLLPGIPDQLPSHVLRDLAKRLILSSAEPPSSLRLQASADAESSELPSDPAVLAKLRAEQLYAMGEIAGLNSLLKFFPERRDDETLQRFRADGLLLAGKWEEGCRTVYNAAIAKPEMLYWQEARIACHAVAGRETQALLGLDILRESGSLDPSFAGLADGLLGLGQPSEEPAFAPLYLAMMERLGIAPSETFRSAAPAGWDAVFARLTALPLEERTPIAERAVGNGALAPEQLAALYLQPIFDPVVLDDPLPAANGDMPAWQAHALIYQATRQQSYPLLRSQLLNAFVERMAADGLRVSGLRLVPKLAESIAPSPSLSWAAPNLARAYYLSGELKRAEDWRINQQQTAHLLTPLWPYLQVVTGGFADQAVLDAWVLSRTPAERELHAALAQSLINAFHDSGLGLQPEGMRQRIQEAALGGQAGETILLILREFGDRELSSLDVPGLALAVGALHHVGYTSEARALATEALIANGV